MCPVYRQVSLTVTSGHQDVPCPSLDWSKFFNEINVVNIVKHHQPMVLLIKFVEDHPAGSFDAHSRTIEEVQLPRHFVDSCIQGCFRGSGQPKYTLVCFGPFNCFFDNLIGEFALADARESADDDAMVFD